MTHGEWKTVFQRDHSNSSEEGTVQATFLKITHLIITRNYTTTKAPIKCKSPSKPLSPKADGLRVGNDWQHYWSQEYIPYHHLSNCAWNYALKNNTRNKFLLIGWTLKYPCHLLPLMEVGWWICRLPDRDSIYFWFHKAKKGQLGHGGLFIKSPLWL